MIDWAITMAEVGRSLDSCLNIPAGTLNSLDDPEPVREIRCYGG
jgi:hypothetical protein